MYAELSQAQKRHIRKTLRSFNGMREMFWPDQFAAPCCNGYEAAWFNTWQTNGLRIKYLEMGN